MTLERFLRAAVVGVSAWILAGLALVAVVHVDDRYRVSHVSGVWMALARYVGDGTFYPALYDGERFGGTRFMPLEFLLHAGVAEATGEYLVSGKLLALVVAAALLALVVVALRSVVGAPLWLSFGLAALLVPSQTGLNAFASIRGDALPVALQLAAVVAFVRRPSARGSALAAVLCAAAVLAKVSAVWAPLAIVAWLVVRERERLWSFVVPFVAALGASLAAVELASGGRFSDNVLGLSTSALADWSGVFSALTTKPLTLLESDAAAIWLVLPIALTELALATRARRLTIFHVAFVAAVLVTLALMTDVGVVSNHLIDVEVLAVLLVGSLWVALAADDATLRTLVAVVVLWALVGTYVLDMHGDVRAALRTSDEFDDPLGALVENERLLSEDATVEVEAGRHPTVLDPFMLVRLLDEHPEWESDLVRRIDDREFGFVVLLADHVRADGSIDVDNPRWRREHFGRPVVDAIARSYRFRSFAGSYAVYEPR